MIFALLAVTLAADPFPLPTIGGKAPAVTSGQKIFRLPMRFERAKAFYEEQFKEVAAVTLRPGGTAGARTLALSTSTPGSEWKSATIREGEVETVVEVKWVLVLGVENVSGKAPPVQF